MEIVAMVLSSLPVPPLPMIAGKEMPDEITYLTGDQVVCNSHDLMGMLLLTAMQRGQQKENEERSQIQKQITSELFEEIAKIDDRDSNSENHIYTLFCNFTRKNIKALSGKEDVCFLPLKDVQREVFVLFV